MYMVAADRVRSERNEHVVERLGLLAQCLLPVASFILQYALSVQSHTQAQFFRHFTCAYVDWLFVPFNLVVVRIIDWRRGGSLLLIVLVSVIANIIAHATWQYYGIDGGHMISRGTQTVLPAGWVHLGFSIIETTLILAFVFIRRPRKPFTRIATVLALTFFLAAGVSGYVINHGFITTDVIVVWSGTALVAVYPWVRRRVSERCDYRTHAAARACRVRSYDTQRVRPQFKSKEHHESRVTPQALVISKGARKAASPPDLAPHYATITTGCPRPNSQATPTAMKGCYHV